MRSAISSLLPDRDNLVVAFDTEASLPGYS